MHRKLDSPIGKMATTGHTPLGAWNKKRVATLATCALAINCASLVRAQTSVTTDADTAHAERQYIFDLNRPSLHSQPFFPDGARGIIQDVPIALRSVNRSPPSADTDDLEAHLAECSVDALAVGELVSSEAILTSNKGGIYTLSRFRLSQVLKSDGTIGPGQTVVTYRRGGQVVDAGEVLRVQIQGQPAYQMGESYLLQLKSDAGAAFPQYFAPDYGTISVRNERIYPSWGKWAAFSPGAALPDVIAKLTEMSAIPCDVN